MTKNLKKLFFTLFILIIFTPSLALTSEIKDDEWHEVLGKPALRTQAIDNQKTIEEYISNNIKSWQETSKKKMGVFCYLNIDRKLNNKIFASSSQVAPQYTTSLAYTDDALSFLVKKGYQIPKSFFDLTDYVLRTKNEALHFEHEALVKNYSSSEGHKNLGSPENFKDLTKILEDINTNLRKRKENDTDLLDLFEKYKKDWLTHTEVAISLELLNIQDTIDENVFKGKFIEILGTEDSCFQCQHLLNFLSEKLGAKIRYTSNKVFTGPCFLDLDNKEIMRIKKEIKGQISLITFDTRDTKEIGYRFIQFPISK